jgi:L-cysteine desulfidase
MVSSIGGLTEMAAEPDMSFFTSLLKKELVVAMGCTEPAAAALAGASARRAFGVMPDRILIRASRDIIKNAMHAGIPHTELKGINAAVALGVSGGDPARGLNIFSSLDSGTEDKARSLLRSGKIKLELAERVPPVFIEVRFEAGARRLAARIRDNHSRVEIVEDPGDESGPDKPAGPLRETELGLPAIYEYTSRVSPEEISFLVDGARTNLELARHSIETGYGIQVGKTMIGEGENTGNGRASPDYLFRLGASLAAAASDARMAGCSMPVVINSGSGNQGITVSVPVLVLAEGFGAGPEETARALCLAHLTALMITARKDRLSALCGAFTAAIGTAAGFVRLLGGDYRDTERCIGNMVGNLIGLLCDGAKGSCALKIYSCVEAAAMGAKIAMAGRSIPPSEGVLGGSLDETLEAIRKISHEGMVPLDKTVLDLMLEKNRILVDSDRDLMIV